MWPKLAILLNCIPVEKLIACEHMCSNEYVRNLVKRSQLTKSWNCQPLPEDLHLRSFGALKLEHAALKFDINKLNELSLYDEHLLRLCNLRRFGYMIASFSKASEANFFEYDVAKATFSAPSISTSSSEVKEKDKEAETKAATAGPSKEVDRRVQLMKSMAQLRLEAEISQLESSMVAQWSPYLVLDTLALCHWLKLVQELTQMNKFILIIPLAVIDTLDRMKKDSKMAREAIRWLEHQFKQGNRFMRAQNQNERPTSGSLSELVSKKKDLEAWCFGQLVECCMYFQKEANNRGSSSSHEETSRQQNMVTLLISDEKEAAEKLQTSNFKLILNCAKENSNIKDFF